MKPFDDTQLAPVNIRDVDKATWLRFRAFQMDNATEYPNLGAAVTVALKRMMEATVEARK